MTRAEWLYIRINIASSHVPNPMSSNVVAVLQDNPRFLPSFPTTFSTTERHLFLINCRWLINNPGSDNNVLLRDAFPVDFKGFSLRMGLVPCQPHIQMEIWQGTCRKLHISSHSSLLHHFGTNYYLPPFDLLSLKHNESK